MYGDHIDTLYISDFWEWKGRNLQMNNFTRLYINLAQHVMYNHRPISISEMIPGMPNIREVYLHEPDFTNCEGTLVSSNDFKILIK